MKRLLVAIALAWLLPGGAGAAGGALEQQTAAVVRLNVTSQSWDVRQPWTKNAPRKAACSGFLIDEGILTNAHCIVEATFIEVEFQHRADKVEGTVKAVNHQLDLALVELRDRSALAGIRAIDFGPLPQLRDKVVTVGFPMGGRQVSFTEGVVSRIDIMTQAHSNMPGLMVQTDAAINPGNSGGPVFHDQSGRCLGVATQKNTAAEGQGYFVPTPMIRQFLDDAADGSMAGIANLGVVLQTMENPALRAFYRLPDGVSGVRVSALAVGGSGDGALRVGDVLTHIAGQPIFNDGRVAFRGDEKIALGYYLYARQVGEVLELRIVRDGAPLTVPVTLRPYRYAVVPHLPAYDQEPAHAVFGGVVFSVVEPRYLQRWGGVFSDRVPAAIARYVQEPWGTDGLEELVVISTINDAPLNKGYAGQVEDVRVLSIDGRPVRSLRDVVAGFAADNTAPFAVVGLEGGTELVLDRAQLRRDDADIRRRYAIP